jgi:outer membrane protein
MTRLLLFVLPISMLLIGAPALRAQASKIAVVDFERALVESAEGKKSSERFNGTLQSKQADGEKRQKELEDAQKKLQTQERTLSETAKANLQKDIDRRTTEFQRFSEDSQKELQTLRDELLRPIAERASAILNTMAAEQGYLLIVDISNPQNNVLWFNPAADVTAELTRRIDAATPQTSGTAPAGSPSSPRPANPASPRPTSPATAPVPRPATPAPAPAPPKQP